MLPGKGQIHATEFRPRGNLPGCYLAGVYLACQSQADLCAGIMAEMPQLGALPVPLAQLNFYPACPACPVGQHDRAGVKWCNPI